MGSSASESAATCFLSIIVPAYNEEKRLPNSLPRIIQFGSTDRTADIVTEFQKEAEFITLIPVEHGGKGHAVKSGMAQARGEYLFLCDSDLSMPIEEVTKFFYECRHVVLLF